MVESAASLLESDVSRSLLDGFSDPAFLLDLDRRVRSVNEAFRAGFRGGSPLLGRPCHEILHGASTSCRLDPSDCPVLECAARGRSVHCLHVHRGTEQEEHQRVSVHPLRRGDGEMVGFLQTFKPLRATSAVAHPHRLVGRSRVFLEMLDRLRRAAENDLPVLLYGEPGTGKRLAGRTIHELSERRHGPLVNVDATALAAGAAGRCATAAGGSSPEWRRQVESARGGTLVIHEVGKLPRAEQSEMLLWLGQPGYGESSTLAASREARVVSTVSRPLEACVRSGTLLPELSPLLAVETIPVPPLRARMEDLALLVDSLFERIASRRSPELESAARRRLADYCFPGNVRELLGLLQRASLLAEGEPIRLEHLEVAWRPCDVLAEAMRTPGEILPLQEVERRYLEWAERVFEGSNSALARALGIAERTLYRKLRALPGRRRAERRPSDGASGDAADGTPAPRPSSAELDRSRR